MSVTRRNFGLCLAAAASGRAQISPIRRYIDPSTEVEVYALSDPENASYLTHHYNRSVSSRNGFLVYATETPQGVQALRLELKGGARRVITSAAAMKPKSLALSPDDRTLYFADGETLLAVPSGGGKAREIYKASGPEVFGRGLSLSEDGTGIALVDQGKLMVAPTAAAAKGGPRVVAEVGSDAEQAALARGGAMFYRDKAKGLYVVTPGGKAAKLEVEGPIGPAVWNPDGKSILYLRANALWEYALDTNKETLVGKTSTYVHFGRNADSSVFVGASGSKAQPFVLLMLRITRRELALCEHKASDATQVSPVFAPNSQRVFFQSDRLGKPVIFSVMVDRLVERTEAEEVGKKS